MKKVIIIIVISIVFVTMGLSQRYTMQYTKNPAFNTFLQGDGVSQVSASSTLAFIGYEGAPRQNVLKSNFGLNAQKNIAFVSKVSQYKLADFSETNLGLGYVYKIPETNWSMGLIVDGTWSKFDLSNIHAYDYIDQSLLTNPMPGLDANAGVLYQGESFIFSLSGKQQIIGISKYDKSLNTNLLLDIGYQPVSTETIGLAFSIGTNVVDFNAFKSAETLPIHLDVIVDIMQSFQVVLRTDYTEGMSLGLNQQTNRFIWFVNQKIPFLMFGSLPSVSIMTTEIGFGFRFSGNKTGLPLPHLRKEGVENKEEGGEE